MSNTTTTLLIPQDCNSIVIPADNINNNPADHNCKDDTMDHIVDGGVDSSDCMIVEEVKRKRIVKSKPKTRRPRKSGVAKNIIRDEYDPLLDDSYYYNSYLAKPNLTKSELKQEASAIKYRLIHQERPKFIEQRKYDRKKEFLINNFPSIRYPFQDLRNAHLYNNSNDNNTSANSLIFDPLELHNYCNIFSIGHNIHCIDPYDKTMRKGKIIDFLRKKNLFKIEFNYSMEDDEFLAQSPPKFAEIDLFAEPHCWEYIDLVWAKLEQYTHWPAEAVIEYKYGKLHVSEPGTIPVYWSFTREDRIDYILPDDIKPFKHGLIELELAQKRKQKLSKQICGAVDMARPVFQNYAKYWVNIEHDRRIEGCKIARKYNLFKPEDYLGRKVSVYWELDLSWYSGIVKQYNVEDNLHFIVYDDGAVEWLNIKQTHYVSFQTGNLYLDLNSGFEELDIIELQSFYRTYREYKDGIIPSITANITQSPLLNKMPLKDPSNEQIIEYSTQPCWECGNIVKYIQEKKDSLQCIRCNKLCHSRCFQIMKKRIEKGVNITITQNHKPTKTTNNNLTDPSISPDINIISSSNPPSSTLFTVQHNLLLDQANIDSIGTLYYTPPKIDEFANNNDNEQIGSNETNNNGIVNNNCIISVSEDNPRCPDCLSCESCGLYGTSGNPPTDRNPNELISCDICYQRVHIQCLDPPLNKSIQPINGWICARCLQCRCCKTSNKHKQKQINENNDSMELVEVNETKEFSSKEEESIDCIEKSESIIAECKEEVIVDRIPKKRSRKKPHKSLNGDAEEIDSLENDKKKKAKQEESTIITTDNIINNSDNNPIISEIVEKNFWDDWSFYAFLMCGLCSKRMIYREYCAICSYLWVDDLSIPMVECSTCKRWIHLECDPSAAQVDESILTRDTVLYNCPECIKRSACNEMIQILDELAKLDRVKAFAFPVTEGNITIKHRRKLFSAAIDLIESAPDYFKTIKTPMDFSTIYKKLHELAYQDIEQFKYDLNLVWRNAKDYNPTNSAVYRLALKLQSRSTQLFAELATKHQAQNKGLQVKTGKIEDRLEAKLLEEKPEDEISPAIDLELNEKFQIAEKSCYQILRVFTSVLDLNLIEFDSCLLCGSYGDTQDLLICIDCGECIHWFCISEYLLLPLNPNQLNPKLNSSRIAGGWRCLNCRVCSICDKKVSEIDLIQCDSCDDLFHKQCIIKHYGKKYINISTPHYTGLKENHVVFKCENCVECKYCHSKTAGPSNNSIWHMNYESCESCAKEYRKGSFCPVCLMIYIPGQFENNSAACLACDECNKWVHLTCCDVSKELYKELGSNIQYKFYCPICCNKNNNLAEIWRKNKKRAELSAANTLIERNLSEFNSTNANQYYIFNLSKFNNLNNFHLIQKFETQFGPTICYAAQHFLAQLTQFKRKRRKTIQTMKTNNNNTLLTQAIAKITANKMSIEQSYTQHITIPYSTDFAVQQENFISSDELMQEKQLISTSITQNNNSQQLYSFSRRNRIASSDNIITSSSSSTIYRKKNGICNQMVLRPLKFISDNVDSRRCFLCGLEGDYHRFNSDLCLGRLLPASAFNTEMRWVHIVCCVWASVGSISSTGAISALFSTAKTIQTNICSICGLNGASLHCSGLKCPVNYHLNCALSQGSNITYLNDTRIYCPNHQSIPYKRYKQYICNVTPILKRLFVKTAAIDSGNGKIMLATDEIQRNNNSKGSKHIKPTKRGKKRRRINKKLKNRLSNSDIELENNINNNNNIDQQDNESSSCNDSSDEQVNGIVETEDNKQELSLDSSSPIPEFSSQFTEFSTSPPTRQSVYIRIGSLSVLNLGSICVEFVENFHNSQFIFPINYSAIRIYWSYKNPNTRTLYSLAIRGIQKLSSNEEESEEQKTNLIPFYTIIAHDDSNNPIESTVSSSSCFSELVNRFGSNFSCRNNFRRFTSDGDIVCVYGLSGPHFFGYATNEIKELIEFLPDAEECKNYKFKYNIDHYIPETKLNNTQNNQNDNNNNSNTLTTNVPPVLHPSLTSSIFASESPIEGSARSHGFDSSNKDWRIVGVNWQQENENKMDKDERFGSCQSIDPANSTFNNNSNNNNLSNTLNHNSSSQSQSLIPSSNRSSRAKSSGLNNRMLGNLSVSSQYRLMKISPLKVRVGHSAIHEWGLFATELLEEGTMIIEYLGELIRQSVADLREKHYESNGLDSTYMFKIDDDQIVDGTKKGNISRFINHSCDPNAVTRMIDIGTSKKIVVQANRLIYAGEEVTYDYFFASEDDRIQCKCGSVNCAGRLN